ncbi:MAG: translation initiation factor IF-1 [Patescibacteria group bacterium]
MTTQKAKESVNGIVVEALPNTLFKLKIDNQKEELLAYLSGKMRLYRIKVLVGDKVIVELEPYGGKGRIIKRV